MQMRRQSSVVPVTSLMLSLMLQVLLVLVPLLV